MALGTGLEAVAAWISSHSLDPEYEAQYLMLPSCGEHEIHGEQTPYQGVQRVLPRTMLHAELATGRVAPREYWDWLDRLEEPASQDLGTLGRRYLELLRQAVRTRLSGLTAAHLSGGMDSTSAALLALAEIEAGKASGPLHTISLVYDSMSVLARATGHRRRRRWQEPSGPPLDPRRWFARLQSLRGAAGA